MIVTFYGTSAELIKMYGIIKAIPRDQQLLICNAQQFKGLQKVHAQLSIEPDLYIGKGWRGEDVANFKQVLGMMVKSHWGFAKNFRKIKKTIKENGIKHSTKSIVLVHGDTLTTLAGSYLGRLLGLPVAHIEAGLRSGSWKVPFPEEIDRRIVAKFSRYHFAPNDLAEQNLLDEKTKGVIINTGYNTAKDAIEASDNFVSPHYKTLRLPKKYTLALLHRTELLESKVDLEAILRTIREYAEKGGKVVFLEHSTTKQKIHSLKLTGLLEHKNITILPKQPYFDFMAIVKNSDAVLTDGGGLQEDAFFLGIPAIIHRERTERQEGLGINAELSGMSVEKVSYFLKYHPDKKKYKRLTTKSSPSKIIVRYLEDNGFFEQVGNDN